MHCTPKRVMIPTMIAATLMLAAPLASADPLVSVRSGVNLDSNDPLVGAGLLASIGNRW